MTLCAIAWTKLILTPISANFMYQYVNHSQSLLSILFLACNLLSSNSLPSLRCGASLQQPLTIKRENSKQRTAYPIRYQHISNEQILQVISSPFSLLSAVVSPIHTPQPYDRRTIAKHVRSATMYFIDHLATRDLCCFWSAAACVHTKLVLDEHINVWQEEA